MSPSNAKRPLLLRRRAQAGRLRKPRPKVLDQSDREGQAVNQFQVLYGRAEKGGQWRMERAHRSGNAIPSEMAGGELNYREEIGSIGLPCRL